LFAEALAQRIIFMIQALVFHSIISCVARPYRTVRSGGHSCTFCNSVQHFNDLPHSNTGDERIATQQCSTGVTTVGITQHTHNS